jgi:glucose-6-phosphate-specific signal transduction histidine kinase
MTETPDTACKLELKGMEERASLAGGALTIECASDSGTRIFMAISLPDDAPPGERMAQGNVAVAE